MKCLNKDKNSEFQNIEPSKDYLTQKPPARVSINTLRNRVKKKKKWKCIIFACINSQYYLDRKKALDVIVTLVCTIFFKIFFSPFASFSAIFRLFLMLKSEM